MHDDIIKKLKNFKQEPPATEASLQMLDKIQNIKFPEYFLDFLKESNGGEGFIGENSFILWKTEELEQLNREYEVENNAPGIFLFGSNGGGEAYGFDTRKTPYTIVIIPFIGMDLEDAIPLAENFLDFFIKLENDDIYPL